MEYIGLLLGILLGSMIFNFTEKFIKSMDYNSIPLYLCVFTIFVGFYISALLPWGIIGLGAIKSLSLVFIFFFIPSYWFGLMIGRKIESNKTKCRGG